MDDEFLKGISGLHFHALCEESSESLAKVLAKFEADFGEFIPQMHHINFGGGHHMTKKGYNRELLINLIKVIFVLPPFHNIHVVFGG